MRCAIRISRWKMLWHVWHNTNRLVPNAPINVEDVALYLRTAGQDITTLVKLRQKKRKNLTFSSFKMEEAEEAKRLE